MTRVFVVDDSPSVRLLLAARLRSEGHEAHELADAESAALLAAQAPPDVVVTDLTMPGLSGVQLCRLLRSDAATAHVPVILLTASGDKRSRFWARSAGATAYIGKDRIDDVLALVASLSGGPAPPVAREAARGDARSLQERISAILDDALFESVLAGEVRSLASAGDLARLFEGLVALTTDVLSVRWLGLLPDRPYAPLLVHGHPSEKAALEGIGRAALGVAPDREVHVTADARTSAAPGPLPHVVPLVFGGVRVGQLAFAPSGHGFSHQDERVLGLLAAEIAGPLQMTSLYEDARRLATTDALTGLLNRRAFLDALERERARSERHVLPVSLLLLDVDHFKRVNDTYGHAAGDAVLRGVARTLLPLARRSDLVARWGGEELVVLLPQTGADGARIVAERVRRGVADARQAVDGRVEPLRVTVSVGAASAEAPWSVDGLVAAADEAMYAAKERGRNRVEVALPLEARTSIRRIRAARLSGS